MGYATKDLASEWVRYLLGPQGKAWFWRNGVTIEYEGHPDLELLGNEQVPGYYFRVKIHNQRSKTLRVRSWKLTDLHVLVGENFEPWENAEPVPLEWGKGEIASREELLVDFARIFPPEIQKKAGDQILTGGADIPNLRFTVVPGRWPRKMISNVSPGTYRFKLTLFFDDEPPATAKFELERPGKRTKSIKDMAEEITIRKLK